MVQLCPALSAQIRILVQKRQITVTVFLLFLLLQNKHIVESPFAYLCINITSQLLCCDWSHNKKLGSYGYHATTRPTPHWRFFFYLTKREEPNTVSESRAPQEVRSIYSTSAQQSQTTSCVKLTRNSGAEWLPCCLAPTPSSSSSLCSSICSISTGAWRRTIGIDLTVVWVAFLLLHWGKHFLPVSRWDEDVLHSEVGKANVLETHHLRSSVLERAAKASTNQPTRLRPRSFHSDVQRAIRRSHITNPNQKNIDQSPNTQAPEAEQLAQTLSPLAQIKTICTKTPECNATDREWGEKKRKTSQRSLKQIITSTEIVVVFFYFSGARFTWGLMLSTICILQSNHKIIVLKNVFYL